MGLVVTLHIAGVGENSMLLQRSRFPKAMGGMLLGISAVFLVMYQAANVYVWMLFNSPEFIDKVLFFTIAIVLVGFPLLGTFLLFYDKKIVVDKVSAEIYVQIKFMFIPLKTEQISFDQVDEIVVENICKGKTVAMMRAMGKGNEIRAGHWLISLRGKELGKKYFDRYPKKDEIFLCAENLSRLTSKKVVEN
ncbi:MAG: hypothetical protein GY941_18610 [Planctomycetes bacterium]|nr:hypothetical protein [Planctomycetota bacterium]